MNVQRLMVSLVNKRCHQNQLRFVYQQQKEIQKLKNSKGHMIKTSMESENFEKFYRKQGICEESEFQEFLESCRKGLPSVFRVVLNKPESKLILSKLKGGLFKNAGLRELSWYPDDNAFRFEKTRWELKEDKECHKMLDTWRNTGSVYRQEQVSMVPVACMDFESDHAVLDMCSAPGSKTGQVLEAMHKAAGGSIPTGFVIGNEVDLLRTKKLAGNMKLFNSPILAVTAYKGEYFPDLKDETGNLVKYDRIVCDVPCSGDGTIRKNPNVWNDWNPGKGNGRYFLQLKIARRGVQLLKEGGYMAYSSCSINQIENECVIAQLLKEFAGGLELVDMRDRFKQGLRFEPGLDTWSVFDSNMNEYKQFSEVPENMRKSQISREMFPDAETKELNLDRCMRFLPHHNDDGGFFVAILRKTKDIPGKVQHIMKEPRNKNEKDYFGMVQTVNDIYPRDTSEIKDLLNHFELDISHNNVFNFSGSDSGGNSLYYMNNKLKSIIDQNKDTLEVCLLGSRLATRRNLKSSNINYFLKSDAMWTVKSIMSSKRVIEIDINELKQLLSSESNSLEISSLSEDLQNKLIVKDFGDVMLSFKELDLNFPAFSSKDKLFVNINSYARKSLLELLSF